MRIKWSTFTNVKYSLPCSAVSGDAVIQSPNIATIIINANDDSNGVLGFKTATDDDHRKPVVRVNEDVGDNRATFVVTRGGGAFGRSLRWRFFWRVKRGEYMRDDQFCGGVSRIQIKVTPHKL